MAGFTYVFHHFGAPDSPDSTFSMVSEPEEPETLCFPLYVRLPGGLKSRLRTRLGTRLGPRRGASGLTFSLFFVNLAVPTDRTGTVDRENTNK